MSVFRGLKKGAQRHLSHVLTPCIPGMYMKRDGHEGLCSKCPKGHSCIGGDAPPSPCPRNMYVDNEGSSHCWHCNAQLQYSLQGASKCTQCPNNR